MITEQLIKSLTKEQQLNKIYKVELSNHLLKEISGLRNFSKLRYLQLNFNSIRSIQNLGTLVDLRELHLANNQITEIRGLDSNKNLSVLDLSNNRIKKIENIGHLFKLETFIVNNNSIEKIGGMEALKDLKKFEINCNKLESIDSLPVFSKLEVLSAQYNKLTQLSPKIFQKSTKLSRLNLSHNRLQQINFLQNLPALQFLDLSHNQISSLTSSQPIILKYLQYLNISNNKFESLMKVSEMFPELTIFLFNDNFINSEYDIISGLAGCDFLLEISFSNNPMYTPQFEETMFQVYHFERINGKDFVKKPGTKYTEISKDISKNLMKYVNIEDDEEDRKIKMSGFYNEELEIQLTGIRPNRPHSPKKSKAVMSLNYQDFQRAYENIKQNDHRIQMLRNQCKMIFQKNGVIPPTCPIIEAKQQQEHYQEQNHNTNNEPEESTLFTEIKMEKTTDKKVLEMKKVNEEQAKKWKQLKNKEKNFNIRGVVRRGASGSIRKSGTLDSSNHKLPSQELLGGERINLMKTQLNPPRWNNDPTLTKTIGYRPLSAKKKMT